MIPVCCKHSGLLRIFSSSFRTPVVRSVYCSSSKRYSIGKAENQGRVGKNWNQNRSQKTYCSTDTMSASVTVGADPKLQSLREEMKKAGDLAALIVPTSDPHLLESPPCHQRRREFITGFTGSAGTAIITTEKALLWTDGRYFLQAAEELGPGWTLMKMGTPDCPTIGDWLGQEISRGGKVGLDASCHPESQVESWMEVLKKKGIEIFSTEGNLVDAVWTNQPPEPLNPLRIHKEKYAGEPVKSKLEKLRTEMTNIEAGVLVVAKLEEIAWILNLRGGDEPYTPIFISYLLVEQDSATLFVNPQKVSSKVSSHLAENGVKVRSYEEAADAVVAAVSSGLNVWMDPDLVNASMFNAARVAIKENSNGAEVGRIISECTPITNYMGVKNKQEIEGMQEAHLRDGAAIVEFLAWFDKEVSSGKTFTEVEIDKELTGRRAKQDGFVGLSFPTIAGANENGAIIHYNAVEETCKSVDGNTMMLIDSGGQYDCGTTDITRTFHMGTPSAHQKMCFSRVLQGHIGLAMAKFPEKTPGAALDALARAPLWSVGLNYRHGTGHGVGAHLCVHEGPIGISHRYGTKLASEPLLENMIVSNEPGYYEDGGFGCRIENLVLIKEAETPHKFGGEKYLGFENITFVPFQKKMFDLELLSTTEKKWVNEYHSQVWEKISPRIKDEATLQWLKDSTSPIPV